MRVLISGARAPVCLDLARQFVKAGHTVELVDFTSVPIGRFSRAVTAFHRLPSPRFEYAAFEAALVRLIDQRVYDLVVPTCEEVFYFASVKDRFGFPHMFCDSLDRLVRVHDKHRIAVDSERWSIRCPETHLIGSAADWRRLGLNTSDYVFKPVYSRFAAHVLMSPSAGDIERLPFSAGAWVAQKRVLGTEFCLYAIANRGDLKAFCAYAPTYRAGAGAGVYFALHHDPALERFCREFAADLGFHGQFAFDVIREAETGAYFLLECNPRSTSGVHLFGEGTALVNAIAGSVQAGVAGSEVARAGPTSSRMIAGAMLIYGWRGREVGRFIADFHGARDVIWDPRDPLPALGQFAFFGALILRSLTTGKSAQALSSEDLEYNGAALP